MLLHYFLVFNAVLPIVQKHGDIQDSNKSFFVFFFISFLLVVSLISTFYYKATSIYKVLALLLLSILTVFLWIWETHFLFIYLVYILAFIGAVLILFLSVILILPISTISVSRNFFLFVSINSTLDNSGTQLSGVNQAANSITDKVDSLVFLTPPSSPSVSLRPPGFNEFQNFDYLELSLSVNLLQDINYIIMLVVIIFVYYHFIQIFWLIKVQNSFSFKLINDLYNNFKKDYQAFLHNKIASHCSIRVGGCYTYAWTALRPNMLYSSKNSFFFKLPCINLRFFTFVTFETHWLVKLASFLKLDNFGLSIIITILNSLIILLACVYYFIVISINWVQSQFWFFYAYVSFSLLEKSIGESLIQGLLFLGFFCIAIPVPYKLHERVTNVNTLLPDNHGGLENLKVILYERASIFLLISTLVLLVALIGAAVITKNKK